jgi:hypothetical protein
MKAIKEAVLSKDRENKATVARWFEGFWSSHWNLKIVLLVTILLTMVTPTQTLIAESCSLPAGSYEITARLELPHLERWGVDKTTIVCPTPERLEIFQFPCWVRIIHSLNVPLLTSWPMARTSNTISFALNEERPEATPSTSFQETHLLAVSQW